jgi:hypothetical protein
MTGDWTVQLADGAHAIHAEISVGPLNKLKIAWDGEVLHSSIVWLIWGDLRSFQRDTHSFVLGVRGLGLLGRFVLSMDGAEVPRLRAAAPLQRTRRPFTPLQFIRDLGVRLGAAAPLERTPPPAPVQFIRELGVQESEEVVGTEEFPLDNRFGDQPFTTVRHVSRESTNELSVDTSTRVDGRLGLTVLSAIKAEIEAQVASQLGHKIGEKVTESQTLTFSVGPKSAVLYQVVWKRKVRSGERLYRSAGNSVTVPYRINYGLSCEVRTRAQAANE